MSYEEKRVLITGGAGFIGSNLAKKLVELGANVTAIDNLSAGTKLNLVEIFDWPNFHFWNMDVRDKEILKTALLDVDEIFHLAANMGGIAYISNVNSKILEDNLKMDLNMAEIALEKNAKIFYSSSACIYPIHNQEREGSKALKETDAIPANPDSSYGWEKLIAEKIFQAYREDYDLDIRIARFHNCYGPHNSWDSVRGKVIGSLIMKAVEWPSRPFTVWGDGNQERSFIYVDDLVEGVLRLMNNNYQKPLNIGTDRMVKIRDLAKLIIEISGKPITIEYDPTKPQGVRSRNADLTLMKKVLNWEPRTSLEEGVKRTYEWMEVDYDG